VHLRQEQAVSSAAGRGVGLSTVHFVFLLLLLVVGINKAVDLNLLPLAVDRLSTELLNLWLELN
jgi:hypothetical protein